MRILVVGLGSMGKRRIRNLRSLGVQDIFGFDLLEQRRQEASEKYGIETASDFSEGLRKNPEAVVISTPPDWHVPYAKQAAAARKPFFMEASVIPDGLEELIRLCDSTGIPGAPSCTMRFFPGPKAIKRLMEEGTIGKPLVFTYHSGMYLPDWHPWEDYRSFYAGKRATGAAREIVPFELVWLTAIFGPVNAVLGMRGKLSDLAVDIDDIYQILLDFQNGLFGHLQVDVLARDPVRFLRVVGSEGSLEWRMQANEIRVFEAKTKAWRVVSLAAGTAENMYVSPEEPYLEEMRAFLDAVRGEKPFPYTLREDLDILRLLLACEQSADTGKKVSGIARAGQPPPVEPIGAEKRR